MISSLTSVLRMFAEPVTSHDAVFPIMSHFNLINKLKLVSYVVKWNTWHRITPGINVLNEMDPSGVN